MRKRYEFHDADRAFMLARLSAEAQRLVLKAVPVARVGASRYEIELSVDEAEIICDELTDALCSEGIDGASEPNSVGLRLERLVDVFNPHQDD